MRAPVHTHTIPWLHKSTGEGVIELYNPYILHTSITYTKRDRLLVRITSHPATVCPEWYDRKRGEKIKTDFNFYMGSYIFKPIS